MKFLNTLKTSFEQWIERVRNDRTPNQPSAQELAVIAEILDRAEQHNCKAEVVARALYYMQLYPSLCAGDAMILGSSVWAEAEAIVDEE